MPRVSRLRETLTWDRGKELSALAQYLAIRYTQAIAEAGAEAGAVASVGTTADSYDNAMAEAFNSVFNAELVRNRGPWQNIDDLEIAVAEYIDWYNHRRLHGEIGLIPPVEYENRHHPATTPATTQTAGRGERGLHASMKPGT